MGGESASAGVRRSVNGELLTLVPEFARAEPLREEWELPLFRRLVDALEPGMVVFDVGASFGLYAIAAARRVGAGGRVFAFEPAREPAAALAAHIRWNGVERRVEVVRAAVADRTGTHPFWEQETSFLASLLEQAATAEQARFGAPVRRRDVAAVTLDDFCRTRGVDPDVVKIDVEGAEADVLRGARELLRGRRATVFLEVHHELLRRAGRSENDVFAELEAVGRAWEEVHAESAGTRHYVCPPAG